MSRIYGLGGKDFYDADAEEFFREALTAAETGKVDVPFEYHGAYAGDDAEGPAQGCRRSSPKKFPAAWPRSRRTRRPERLEVELKPLWEMTTTPSRIAPGHGACPGCGFFPMLRQAYSVLEGNVVVLFQTGCAMVTTTGYPKTAHRITYIHNLFQNGAATLSGLVEMYHERIRRGEIPAPPEGEETTFIMVTGDGGMDIGMGAALGTAHRNHKMIILEYDNQGYMNTGSQLSYSTPFGHRTSTSEVGEQAVRQALPSQGHAADLRRLQPALRLHRERRLPRRLHAQDPKAQWYARHEGMVYGKVLSFCPLNWRTKDDAAQEVLQTAIDSCFFPLYEVEKGHTHITYDPDAIGRRRSVADWLGQMGKTKHMLAPENADRLEMIEHEVQKRWRG